MRPWTAAMAVGILASAALAAPASASAAQRSNPPHLRLATADRVADEIGIRTILRHRRLGSLSSVGCRSLTNFSAHCRVELRGEARGHRVIVLCRLGITVRMTDGKATGRIIRHRCDSSEPPYLSRPRAVAAFWGRLLELHPQTSPAERPAQMVEIERVYTGEFTGRGFWITDLSTDVVEACATEMSVSLAGPGQLEIQAKEPECETVSFVAG